MAKYHYSVELSLWNGSKWESSSGKLIVPYPIDHPFDAPDVISFITKGCKKAIISNWQFLFAG